jgi:hypothetical protein
VPNAIEKFWPYVVAAAATLCLYLFSARRMFEPFFTDSLLSTSITYGSIVIGFLSTSLAILGSIHNTPIMENIRKLSRSNQLFGYLWETVAVALFAVITNFVGFFMACHGTAFQLVWFLVMIASCTTLIRIIRVFVAILSRLGVEQ